MEAPQPAKVAVSVAEQGKVTNAPGEDVINGVATVQEPRLYKLVHFADRPREVTATLTFDKGVSANACTFR